MTHTTNYELSQWQKSDRVLMADFNSDNSKIDAALKAVADAVSTKAEASALSALTTTVNGKADASTVSALTTTVNGKAEASTVTALSNTVNGKADASTVTALSNTVNGKADASTVTALSNTVSAKADTSALNALAATVPKIGYGSYTIAAGSEATSHHVELGFRPKVVLLMQQCSFYYSADTTHMNRALFSDGVPVVGPVGNVDRTFAEVDNSGFTVYKQIVGGNIYYPRLCSAGTYRYLAIG